jgi:membrane protease YdiL (CAAX protease family)
MYFSTASKGKNDIGLYLIGIVIVFLFYVIGQLPLTIVQMYKVGQDSSIGLDEVQKFSETMDFSIFGIHKNMGLILLILIFFFAMAGLLLVLKMHKKRLIDLIAPDAKVDLNRILYGFAFWFLLTLLAEFVLYLVDPDNYTFRWSGGSFVALVIISLVMLPVQTSFEELFFRGYIMQGVAFHTKNAIISLIVSSIFFGLIHGMNPEVGKFGFITMMLYYISAGLFLGLVTIMDGRLELALGIHAATNIYGATIATYEGSVLQTDSLLVNKVVNPYVMLLIFVLAAALFYYFAAKKYHWQGLQTLKTSVNLTPGNETSTAA